MNKHILTFLLLYIVTPLGATIINVPANFSTIQQAISSSVSGDTIIVQPGTYYENINFRGKNILLTSMYYLNNDTSFITSTIINGSIPAHPDSASCVIFNSGETAAAILQGFTITGGAGSKWNDIHGAGLYREGGGVLIELSSPSVLHNIIVNNIITNMSGVTSTGGGGIRIGDGNPLIQNNIIAFNQARYGAGIVLNYTGCTIRNNIIASNSGGQDFNGGSAIWIYNNLSATPKLILNNTIVNNSSSLATGTGGISVWSANNVSMKNNIIWSNTPALQVKSISAAPSGTYCDVQGGFAGAGNIDTDPFFNANCYYLNLSSPCVDAGDSTTTYDDLSAGPGSAQFPSLGGLRNDMGAYGGPYTSVLNCLSSVTGISESFNKSFSIAIYPNPSDGLFIIRAEGLRHAVIEVFDSFGKKVCFFNNFNHEEINLSRFPKGIYHIRFDDGTNIQTERIVIN